MTATAASSAADARHDFMRSTGYPHGRRGYVIDHIRPLECGGLDIPSKLPWQTIDALKEEVLRQKRGLPASVSPEDLTELAFLVALLKAAPLNPRRPD